MSLLSIGSQISGIAGIGSGLAQSLLGQKRDGMKSGLNIESFKGILNEVGGLYKPNLFMVSISPHNREKFFSKGRGSSSGSVESGRIDVFGDPRSMDMWTMYFCNSAALPGVQIITSDHRRQGFGTFDRRPFGVQVTDIPLTFFVDNDGMVLEFFDMWTNQIVNHDLGARGTNAEHSQSTSGQQLFEIGYRNQYLCTVEIFCLAGDITHDRAAQPGQGKDLDQPGGGTILHYTLHEAFPMQVGDITVAWSETDSFSILPVQFTFRSFSVNRMSMQDRPKSPMGDRAFSLAQTLGVLSGAAGIVGSFQGLSAQGILSHATNVLANRKIISNMTRIF